ncbi:MAG: translation elongation factor Ts [Deltaproteobacteria bacterium]|nr:translation elongation factor Ts [Deltaproteobacteria bacterium]
MDVSAEKVKDLREKTGAGVMDCKKALSESLGDLEKAVVYLREKGITSAQKKAARATSEGAITSYIHGGGKVGVLLELNCETDFVARNDDFKALARDIAMHIAAMAPVFVKREDVPQDVIEKEKAVYSAQARQSGKPDGVVAKIVEGKVGRFFKDVCLLEQDFVKNPDVTVGGYITEAISRIGENIKVGRFVRFKLGEGAASRP